MAALPPVPNVIKLQLKFSIGADQSAMNVFYFRYTGGPPSSTDLNNFAASAANAYGTSMGPDMSNTVTLIESIATDMNSASGQQGSANVAHTGADTTAELAADTCVVMNHVIGRRYRGGKPRHYLLLGTSQRLQSPTLWGSSWINGVTASFGTWLSSIVGNVFGGFTITAFVNVSYYLGYTQQPYGTPTKYRQVPTLRPGGPVIDVITSSAASSIPGSQRRRVRPG